MGRKFWFGLFWVSWVVCFDLWGDVVKLFMIDFYYMMLFFWFYVYLVIGVIVMLKFFNEDFIVIELLL